MTLFYCSVLIKRKKKHEGVTRHKVASEVFNLTAMEDGPRHVAGCREMDSSEVLYQAKYPVKDNTGQTKSN